MISHTAHKQKLNAYILLKGKWEFVSLVKAVLLKGKGKRDSKWSDEALHVHCRQKRVGHKCPESPILFLNLLGNKHQGKFKETLWRKKNFTSPEKHGYRYLSNRRVKICNIYLFLCQRGKIVLPALARIPNRQRNRVKAGETMSQAAGYCHINTLQVQSYFGERLTQTE